VRGRTQKLGGISACSGYSDDLKELEVKPICTPANRGRVSPLGNDTPNQSLWKTLIPLIDCTQGNGLRSNVRKSASCLWSPGDFAGVLRLGTFLEVGL
jgi:hypothetical protein